MHREYNHCRNAFILIFYLILYHLNFPKMQHNPRHDYCVLVFCSIKIWLKFFWGWLLASIHLWLSNRCFQPGYILIPDMYFCLLDIFTWSPHLSKATVLNANMWNLSSIVLLFVRSVFRWMSQDSCPGYSRLSLPISTYPRHHLTLSNWPHASWIS